MSGFQTFTVTELSAALGVATGSVTRKREKIVGNLAVIFSEAGPKLAPSGKKRNTVDAVMATIEQLAKLIEADPIKGRALVDLAFDEGQRILETETESESVEVGNE